MSGIAKPTRSIRSSAAACVAAFLCIVAPAFAEDLATQTEAANKLLQDGKPREALDAYSAAISATPAPPPELLFNRACALLADSKLPDAETDFRAVLARNSSDSLRAAAFYNLGLIESRQADVAQEKAVPEAIEHLRRSERCFRSSTAITPDPAAARNIDLIQRRLAALLEQQKQEQQKQEEKEKQ